MVVEVLGSRFEQVLMINWMDLEDNSSRISLAERIKRTQWVILREGYYKDNHVRK